MAKAKISRAVKEKAAPFKRVDYHEFIPYYTHFNPHTLMTKDGELVQVIKIDGNARGEPNENMDGIHETIRDAIRDVLSHTDVTEKVAFWLHTIRRRRPLQFSASFPDDFSGYVNGKWEKTTHQAKSFEHSYYNEVYITFMHDAQVAPFIDKQHLKDTIFPERNRKFRNEYLDNLQIKMDAIGASILERLASQCHAKRLGLVERPLPTSNIISAKIPRQNIGQNIFYSELMEFFGNIFNLRNEPFPLPDMNVSVALQTSVLDFGFNALEAKSKKTGDKRFASLLTLKQFRDIPIETVDRVLQAPIEMVISQNFVFMPAEKVLKHYEAQKEYFELSGDTKSMEDFGIKNMLASNRKKITDFGEQQISIMVMVDDFEQLDRDVRTFQQVFMDLGLVSVREDIRMEECFWAQFPGNFEFVRRRNTIALENIGGFCRLNRFSSGSVDGNHWGKCVSQIPTSVGSPYYFNFHVGDNGHTAFFDFNSFGDSSSKILQYFLLSQTRKFPARMFLFDRNQSARLFLNKMGGNYFPLKQISKINRDEREDKSPRLALNPFSLEASPYNQSFLAAWCGLLISPDAPLDSATKDILRGAVAQLYNLPEAERNLPNMAAIVASTNAELAAPLQQWMGKGEYAGLFDFAQDSLNLSAGITDMVGFDMSPAFAKPAFVLPLFSYLMHRVIGAIDGSPTIIVLNEAFDLLENAFFAPRLESLLAMLRERGVMVMLTSSSPAKCPETSIFKTVMDSCATHIYIPDEVPLDYPAQNIGLNNHDALMMLYMERQKGDLLLKQNGESIGLKISLQDAEDALAIFTNDIKSLGAAHGRFASLPEDY